MPGNVTKRIKRRILELSFKHRLSHVGSCLSCANILAPLYGELMGAEHRLILSCGHAGMALYVCLELFRGHDAEKLLAEHGMHPHFNRDQGIYATTGSLGYGLPIALGWAMSDPEKIVRCVISDGECAEGSIWETMRFLSHHPVGNLYLHINANGHSAMGDVDGHQLWRQLVAFDMPNMQMHFTKSDLPYAKGLDAHYKSIPDEATYQECLRWVEDDLL